jgi:hypothetical protein
MAYMTGEAREQVSGVLEELIPEGHLCRVIEAFVNRLAMGQLEFVRSEPAETGRPGYDPRDLLKPYLYQLRSSRRLEGSACATWKRCGCWGGCGRTTSPLPSFGGCIGRY